MLSCDGFYIEVIAQTESYDSADCKLSSSKLQTNGDEKPTDIALNVTSTNKLNVLQTSTKPGKYTLATID